MARGEWSFIHESVIYQYLMERFKSNNLKLLQICYNGKFKEKEVKVVDLEEITDTKFPDVDCITIKSDKKGKRPAEVKFLTSQFKYHTQKKYSYEYDMFVINNGFILVYKHDIIPDRLDVDKIDIYQLNQSDFINFVKENFERLFYQQVKEKKDRNVWISYCGRNSNFNKEYVKEGYNIKSAKESKIWCPTCDISPNEMTVGDKIIFIKTSGVKQQHIQNQYESNISEWYLEDMYVCEVRTPIMSREEYCRRNKIDSKSFLWASEVKDNNKDKYRYVFKFDIKTSYENLHISLESLRQKMQGLVDNKIRYLFTTKGDKSISLDDYIEFIEYISQYNYNRLAGNKNLYKENTNKYNHNYIN